MRDLIIIVTLTLIIIVGTIENEKKKTRLRNLKKKTVYYTMRY